MGHSGSVGSYQVRVDMARGIQMEADSGYSNDTTGGANLLSFIDQGDIKLATISGAIMRGREW